jgi:hypothetical protein
VSTRGPIAGTEAGTRTRLSARERRAWERYILAETVGKIICSHVTFPCRFVDISLGGCCARTEQRFTAGALAKVEVRLDLHGVAQRIGGITQWTGRDNLLGIQFRHASPLARNQLAALLTGLIDETAAEAVKEAVASGAIASLPASLSVSSPVPAATSASAASPLQKQQPTAGEPTPVEPDQKESQAVIRLLKDGSQMTGDVVDLSLEGCTLRMTRPFTLGIYVRVEVSFHVCGLVFQLAGVSQEIYDKCTIGFRFLEVSRRRGEELAQVIEELRVAREKQAGEQ